jgi:hypothetical protein
MTSSANTAINLSGSRTVPSYDFLIGDKIDLYNRLRSQRDEDAKSMNEKDYIDAKVDAVRAQNDARFSEVLSEIKGLHLEVSTQNREISANIKSLPTKWSVVGGIVAGIGLAIGIFAYGGDRFDGGVQVSSVSVQQAQEAKNDASKALAKAEESATQIRSMNEKIDTLLGILRERATQ